jgi:HAD superfamily hydrolase (TIGR01509 family)
VIKAVIFDVFGVLVVDSWLPFKEEHFGHDQALFDEASKLNDQANSGRITYDEFLQKIADLAGVEKAFAQDQIDNNPVNRPLFSFIAEELKPSYKIGLLSNAAGDWIDRLFQPEQIKLLDAAGLSYEMGFVKPDPHAYRAVLNQLQVQPEEGIMVDDQKRYCEAAEAIGMKSVHYQDFRQFKTDITQLLSHG